MVPVLICEDEESIRSFVTVYLRHAGFEVLEAASGEEALECCARRPDIAVVLLDVMLPGIDGFEVCARLRETRPRVGILMLTARTQESERVRGLRLGADDYVSKPFSPAELTARVEALCRRVTDANVLSAGGFSLDPRTRVLSGEGVSVELTGVEYQLMTCFLSHAGETLSRTAILRAVWGETYVGDESVVDVNVRRLRMKLERDPSEPRHLVTVRGEGYKFNS